MQLAQELKASVEAHLKTLAFDQRHPANLYAPMAYILALKGKRIRPILTLLAYHTVSGRDPAVALNLAAAVETFHNFTLMHDDIMDRAPVRRGMPSVHVKWDENIAILSGDALFAFATGLVVKDFPEKAAPLAAEFARASMEVCEGQMEDLDLSGRDQVSIEAYLEMIRKKTAVLLGSSLWLGARAGGADEALAERFRAFGEALGIAFQLQDDLMDAFPPANFGKQVGGDIIENKKTYLVLKAHELASPDQRQALEDWLAQSGEVSGKVEGVLDLFRQLNIEAHTQDLIQTYVARAEALSQELAGTVNMAPLEAYLDQIAKRKV